MAHILIFLYTTNRLLPLITLEVDVVMSDGIKKQPIKPGNEPERLKHTTHKYRAT